MARGHSGTTLLITQRISSSIFFHGVQPLLMSGVLLEDQAQLAVMNNECLSLAFM